MCNILGMSDSPVVPAVSPAALVCDRFGGPSRLARLLGLNPSSTWRWLESGSIPSSRLNAILALARELGVSISAEELIRGGAGSQP